MAKKSIDLPSIPILKMRESDMDGSPSSALMVLFHLAADIGIELERLEGRVTTSIEQAWKLPDAIESALAARYTKFLQIHDSVISDLNRQVEKSAKTAKAFTDGQRTFELAEQRTAERIDILVDANGKLVAACEATLAEKTAITKLVTDYEKLVTDYAKLATDYKQASTDRAAASELKSLLDLPLWQLFRAWLARRFTQ